MIIYFSEKNEVLDSFDKDGIEDLLQDLLKASHRGYHCVIIDRSTCRWLRNNLELSTLQSKRLKGVESASPQKEALLRDCPFYLEVGLGHTPLEHVSIARFKIGHLALLNTRILEKSVLVVENSSSDGMMIREILSILKKSHSIKNFDFECHMGGGSTIVNAFEDALHERRSVTVVADNDKAFPGAATSPTMKALEGRAAQSRFPGFVEELPCRDLENLIPLGAIRDTRVRPEYSEEWLDFLMSLTLLHLSVMRIHVMNPGC